MAAVEDISLDAIPTGKLKSPAACVKLKTSLWRTVYWLPVTPSQTETTRTSVIESPSNTNLGRINSNESAMNCCNCTSMKSWSGTDFLEFGQMPIRVDGSRIRVKGLGVFQLRPLLMVAL